MLHDFFFFLLGLQEIFFRNLPTPPKKKSNGLPLIPLSRWLTHPEIYWVIHWITYGLTRNYQNSLERKTFKGKNWKNPSLLSMLKNTDWYDVRQNSLYQGKEKITTTNLQSFFENSKRFGMVCCKIVNENETKCSLPSIWRFLYNRQAWHGQHVRQVFPLRLQPSGHRTPSHAVQIFILSTVWHWTDRVSSC
jgi:hypothetical protein